MAIVSNKRIIGLTGPIAAGKDEVAKILRRRKIPVIDADQLAHTLYVKDSPLWRKLIKAFGSKILNRGGKINRNKLGELVFGDKRKLKELDQLVHPYLKKTIMQEVESNKSKIVAINAAVLKRIGLLDYVDEVWVVMASREVRLKRLLRSGYSKQEAEARLRSQMSKKAYLSVGTVVLENNRSRQNLRKKVLELLG